MAEMTMHPCKWCNNEQDVIRSQDELGRIAALICRRCDTAPATNPGNRLHAGPPNLSGSRNGWFLPEAPGAGQI